MTPRSADATPGMDEPSDRALLETYIAEGSDAAFAAIVRRHGGMVREACRRVLGNTAEVDDATQAALLVLARRARSATADHLADWLYGVAVRSAKTYARERRRRRHREAAVAGPVTVPAAAHPEDHEALRQELDRALRGLPATYREALVLCCLEGHTHEEAGRIACCPAGTVGRRVSEGKKRLRAALERGGVLVGALTAVLTTEASASAQPLPAAWSAPATLSATITLPMVLPPSVIAVLAAVAIGVTGATAWVLHPTACVAAASPAAHPAMPGGTLALTAITRVAAPQGHCWSLAASADASEAIVGTGNGSVVVFALPDLHQTRTLAPHTASVVVLAASRTGAIASGSMDGTVALWPQGLAQPPVTLHGHGSGTAALAFSPDGRELASGDWDGVTRLWRVDDGAPLAQWPGDGSGIGRLAWSPDGARLATGANSGAVVVRSTTTGSQEQRWRHPSPIRALAWLDARTVVGGGGNALVVWDEATGGATRTLSTPDAAEAFAIRDGVVAYGTQDGAIVLVPLTGGTTVRQAAHRGVVTALAWMPDGRLLSAGGVQQADQTLCLWAVDRH